MLSVAVLAIVASVIMHVAWNLMTRHVDPKSDFLWWGLLAHLIMVAPVGVYGLIADAQWSSELLIAIAVTSFANSAYFMSLRQAYYFAPVAVVYPLARSSPLMIALWALLFFDVQLSAYAWLGIILSVGGLFILARSADTGTMRKAIPWAMLAALFTSIYSLSDKAATAYLPSLASLLGFVSIGYFCSFLTLCMHNKMVKNRIIPMNRPPWKLLIPGGLFIGTSYALIIYAMKFLPASFAVALTNAGVVIAVLISIFVMRENSAWKSRLAATGIIVSGLLIICFSLI